MGDQNAGQLQNGGVEAKEAPKTELTDENIRALEDLLSAMDLAEEIGIDVDHLETLDDIKKRLSCHLALVKNGNLKEKIEKQICDIGATDINNREKLSKIVRDLKNIFPAGGVGPSTTRHAVVEELLEKDGTTMNIREDCDKRLASLKEKECVILVSGESSAGKSSLLNLLLGEPILPAHMLPCTSCITVIKYGSYRAANVIYRSGKQQSISPLDKAGLEQLQQRAYYSQQDNASEAYLRRKEEHDIAEIQVFLPLKMLYSGLVLVDTPGIGENEFLENYLMDYIRKHQILGFMYVIMTDYPLGIAEDRLVNLMSLIIKSQKSSSDIIKFNPKAALFVCNRWDMVTDENKRAVRQNAIDQLSKAWPDFDPKNAVFFSTYQAQREQSANPGYVTEDFVALLHGLHDLVAVSYDKRIKASYRWLGNVLQRSVHYLRTMCRHLELNGRNRQKKSQETAQKLKILKEKANGVIVRLYDEMEQSLVNICAEVRNYLKTTQAKTKLTDNFGSKDGELPNMDVASGTWEWVKRQIDNAFDSRLADLVREWDKEGHVIQDIERKLFREAKLELCELENELSEIENEAQKEEDGRRDSLASSGTFLNNLCRSIEDFDDDEMIDIEVPKKLLHQLTRLLSKAVKKRQSQSKLKDYEKEPRKIAQKRAEKLLEKLDKDGRLESFVREYLQRPFNYIRKLESKIPLLIETNMSLLEKFEKAVIEEIKGRQQYVGMMTMVEKLRRSLLDYGEHHFYANDYEENEIEILSDRHRGLRKMPTEIENLMKSAGTLRPVSHYPHGLWHSVHIGRITRGSETRFVIVKLYNQKTAIPNIQQEVAKLRCLLHNDVSIAEFLGVYNQIGTPIPALIFAGKLMSVKNYIKTHLRDVDFNKLLADVLAGLQYIHSKALVHMELTKDSVTVNEKGEVKMTATCLPRPAELLELEANSPMTNNFVYLSPEVLKGAVYSAAADLYSFALLCLEVKTPQYNVFADLRVMECFNVHQFLKVSAKSYLEKDILNLQFPSLFSKERLLSCLDANLATRPSAVSMAREFDNIGRLSRRTQSGSTPGSIFRKASKKYR